MRVPISRSKTAVAAVRVALSVAIVGALTAPQASTFLARRDAQRSGGSVTGGITLETSFGVTGRVRKLYPGARKTMTVRVRNPHGYAIVVRELGVRVRKSDHAGCGRRWVRPKRVVRLSLLVPARSRARASLPVRMRPAAPDACQGARWRLRFRGTAVRR